MDVCLAVLPAPLEVIEDHQAIFGQKVPGEHRVSHSAPAVMQAIHLELDDEVDVREEAGRIVIQPIRRKNYDLDELLKGITSKNKHDPVDFGPPSGKEAW